MMCDCQDDLKLASSRSVGVGVALFSLLFTVMASKVAEPFHCQHGNDVRWTFRASVDVDCFDFGDSTWTQSFVLSLVAAMMFVLGAPAYMLHTIRANRASLGDGSDEKRNFEARYGWMYLRYRANVWFWEFVVMARKVLFVGFGLLHDERLLWAVYLGGTTLAFALQVLCKPFESAAANRVERNHLIVQVITVTLGGAFTFGLDKSSFLATIISVVLIVINFCMLWPVLVLTHDFIHDRCACYRAVIGTVCAKCAVVHSCNRGNQLSTPLLSISGSE